MFVLAPTRSSGLRVLLYCTAVYSLQSEANLALLRFLLYYYTTELLQRTATAAIKAAFGHAAVFSDWLPHVPQ